MDDCDGETSASQGGGAALPRPKRPTIIRPAARVAPAEPPPRPASRANSAFNPNSSQTGDLPGKKKLEITVIDAKPITELGFRDIKGSTGHIAASLPVHNSESTGGTSVPSTQLRSRPEELVVSQVVERVSDTEQYSRISQKPSAPPKSMKPTIIRTGSRAQPVTGEDKPLPAAPPRPATTPHSGPSVQKSPSLQGTQNLQQPVQPQVPLLQSSYTPATLNHPPATLNHPPAQPPAPQPAPKRPPRLPSSGLPKQKSTANVEGTGSKLEANTEIQSPLQEIATNNKNHDIESPKPETALPKPKPMPKPRPISVRSPGFRDDVPSENILNKDINSKTVSHTKQEDISSQKSKWSPVEDDKKMGEDKRLSLAPVPLKKPPRLTESSPKPETGSTTDVPDVTVRQDSIASPREHLPHVHKQPPALPPLPATSGSTPSSVTVRKPDISVNPNSLIEHKPASSTTAKVPPARPASSAPARGKSMANADKIPPVAENSSRSSNVKTVESRKPSQPTASRSQKQSAGPPPLPNRPGPGHPLYHYISRQPHGIARHHYTATQPDELSFSEGDIVILVREMDEHWMVGRVADSEGLFPAAFVDVLCPLSKQKPNSYNQSMDSWPVSDSKGQKPDILTGPRCKARFDFEGDGEGELTLEDGDIVQIVERVGTEWLRGQHRGRQGIFPSSFVEIVEDLPPESSTGGHSSANCVSALFDFDGKDGELIFKAGDQITVLGEVNSEWLFGACHGQEGQFPASFVGHVPSDLPKHKPDHSSHQPKPAPQSQPAPESEPAHKAKIHKDSLIPGDEFWESREDVLGFCRAIFDFVDGSPGDLEFRKGDRIEIVEFFGEDWARGRLGAKEGMFPLKFVAEEVNSPPRTPEPEVVQKVFGKVLHGFDGETPDDLMIKEGDVIEVQDFADINKHWRWGVLDGKRGMFPAEFVEILP